MINRFSEPGGRALLVSALKAQSIVRSDEALAATLADRVTLCDYPADSEVIAEGAPDNDLHFILSGRAVIRVHDRDMAYRASGTQVGEMALIDPGARRSASVIATGPTVTARISRHDFHEVGASYPAMWQYLAMELGDRLRQRNQFVSQPNPIPVLFLGSSRESMPLVELLVAGLDESLVTPRPWTGNLFMPSHATIEDLETQLPHIDFAALVFGPDDTIISRQTVIEGPRDNVLLECGMFVGAIGRDRTYFLKPKGIEVKVPSDLFGLKPLEYDYESGSGAADVASACAEIMRCIARYGPK